MRLKAVKDYLKGCDFSRVEPAEHGTQLLDDVIMADIEDEVNRRKQTGGKVKRVTMQVKPHLIFRVRTISKVML